MRKSTLWIIIGVLGLFITLPLISQYFYAGDNLNFKGGCSMWSGHLWMGGMWIFPLIIFIAVLAVIFSIFNRRDVYSNQDQFGENYSTVKRSETAQEILKKRFAKGAITKEEFEQIKKDLNF